METTIRALTTREVAAILKLTERTVYDYLRQGKLPGRKIGGRRGRWRVLEKDLEAFIGGEAVEDARDREREPHQAQATD